MATPAELRMLELLDKWLGSLDLHLKYSALDEASYAKIQDWPAHQRPNRWIIELARQRTVALRTQVEDRVRMGDSKFADSLEMMIFLANLVGIQHIERYIPLAERERELAPAADAAAAVPASDDEEPLPDTAVTGTREMPPFVADRLRAVERATRAADSGTAPVATAPPAPATPTPAAAPAPSPAGAPIPPAPVVRTPVPTTAKPAPLSEQAATDAAEILSLDMSLGFNRDPPPAARATALSGRVDKADPSPPAAAAVTEAMRIQVLADAERLLQWGRRWFELPELITRMADRPPLIEVRRILRENRAALDKKIRRS